MSGASQWNKVVGLLHNLINNIQWFRNFSLNISNIMAFCTSAIVLTKQQGKYKLNTF